MFRSIQQAETYAIWKPTLSWQFDIVNTFVANCSGRQAANLKIVIWAFLHYGDGPQSIFIYTSQNWKFEFPAKTFFKWSGVQIWYHLE